MWSMIPEFQQRVQQEWKKEIQGTRMYQLVGKLNRTKGVLLKLNKERFSDVEKREEEAMEQLTECQRKIQKDPRNRDLIDGEIQLMKESARWKTSREQFLRQRRYSLSRMLKGMRKKGLKAKAFTDFYTKLLGEKKGNRKHVCSSLVKKGPVVQKEQRALLKAAITDKEIKEALWEIGGDKAPGPDGYVAQFFKDCWQCRRLYINCMLQHNLQDHLKGVVQQTQRSASNYNIRESECLCGGQKYRRTKSCLIKIDLKKAYDTVEWGFVEEMLYALNFPTKFIKWTKECMTTTQYSIAINGEVHGCIEGKRDLRQGDPISPLLFVICMEYFTRIMQWVATHEGFAFHTKCKSLKLNHLCFADDVLMFCKGDYHSIMLLLRGLQTFTNASGLSTNAGKSNIYSANMDKQCLENICEITGYKEGVMPFRYLGVPIAARKLIVGGETKHKNSLMGIKVSVICRKSAINKFCAD
ncbi:PREDICTED: uncharacterized protein LOC109226071 [Nicotiana attenuata]|uniref:uncharacterized protein LOC109226071 n=1 Tax=Nicotiana attenuata TaxID=49451 RepID=UPI00090556BC|nr:PREDICTED: uncharacterized protein LOC109226071 [Nicotiana attenuata]